MEHLGERVHMGNHPMVVFVVTVPEGYLSFPWVEVVEPKTLIVLRSEQCHGPEVKTVMDQVV